MHKRIDRRVKPAPRWEPPSKEPSVATRINNALAVLKALKQKEVKA